MLRGVEDELVLFDEGFEGDDCLEHCERGEGEANFRDTADDLDLGDVKRGEGILILVGDASFDTAIADTSISQSVRRLYSRR